MHCFSFSFPIFRHCYKRQSQFIRDTCNSAEISEVRKERRNYAVLSANNSVSGYNSFKAYITRNL